MTKCYVIAIVTGAIIIVSYVLITHLTVADTSIIANSTVHQHVIILLIVIIVSGQTGDVDRPVFPGNVF